MGDLIGWRDRYGGNYPDPENVCLGPCDGMGGFPLSRNDRNPQYKALWEEAEKKNPSDDGWHIVTCPDCKGTGKKDG